MPAMRARALASCPTDPRQSLRWADEQESVELHLVAGDHQLMEERHLRLMADCARELCERLARPA